MVFAQLLKIGKNFTRWLVLLLYLGGDFVWLLVLILRGSNIFNMHPLESGQQMLENLPRAFAVVVFMASLSLFLIWIKKKDLRLGIILALVFGSLIGFKVYIGLFVLPGLGLLGLYYLYKKQYRLCLPLLLTAVLSFLIYYPVNSGSGGLYFTGFWRFENFIMQGYFGLQRMELARMVYVAHNSWIRVAEYELIYFSLFVFAIFGTKLLGLIQNKKSLSFFPKELHVLLLPGLIISFIIGAFFNQSSGGSVTFNFVASVFIIGSIYTALSLFYWLRNKNKYINYFLIILILLFTLPRGIDQVYANLNSLHRNTSALIDNRELSALIFLKNIKTNSLIMVDPVFETDVSSPYVSFLSNQKMFLSGEWDELEGHAVDYSKRQNIENFILSSTDSASIKTALIENDIGYIYTKPNTYFGTMSASFLKPIFETQKLKF